MSEKKIKEKKEKAKINPMMVLMGLMFILILALGAGLTWLIISQKNAPSSAKPTVVVSTVLELPPLSYPIAKDFIVNLKDTDAKHLIKLNITLAFTSSKLPAELLTIDSFIKDTVISVLSEKKAADFTAKGKDDLKKEFMTRINPYLKSGKISDVYITDILVQ